jgi:branched-subunit amino acid aminotransferase/4-amino-4-deoxychorismate lyase
MTEPLAYWNGTLLPASQLVVPVWDTGFVQGVTVAEQLRTFNGRLFRLDDHLERLRSSLEIVGIELPIPLDELGRLAGDLAARNHRLLAPGDDLGLSLFVTPGPYRAFAPPEARGPSIGMHTYPVAFGAFADKYECGERLIVTDVRQVPSNCWPAALKCRSRMHYFLADRAARQQDPGARALLLDQQGNVSEASTANFLLYRRDTGLVLPPRENILPGVSIAAVEELARQVGVALRNQEFRLDDVWSADEAFLSSTSPCLLPVVTIDGRPVGDGRPGPLFQQLISAWSRRVGLDIVEQARRFAARGQVAASESPR